MLYVFERGIFGSVQWKINSKLLLGMKLQNRKANDSNNDLF